MVDQLHVYMFIDIIWYRTFLIQSFIKFYESHHFKDLYEIFKLLNLVFFIQTQLLNKKEKCSSCISVCFKFLTTTNLKSYASQSVHE